MCYANIKLEIELTAKILCILSLELLDFNY